LDGELVLPWVSVAHELLGPGVEVLLADLDALAERRRRGLIEDLNPQQNLWVKVGSGKAPSP
jgi:hypothetical protein